VPEPLWPLDPWLAPLEHAASARHSVTHAASMAGRAGRASRQRGFLMGRFCRRQGENFTLTEYFVRPSLTQMPRDLVIRQLAPLATAIPIAAAHEGKVNRSVT
jgi:hypothetical protein